MSEINFEAWGIVIFLFLLMGFYSYGFGVQFIQIVLRVRSRDRRNSYEKWGVVTNLFRPLSGRWFAAWSVAVVVGTVFTGLLAFFSTGLLIEEPLPGEDQIYYTITIAMYAFFVGQTVESERIRKITEMTRKLDDLRETFHQRFAISELLSMYESLRPAPPLFWEEYVGLPEQEISEDTNRAYRKRAAPYSNAQFGRYDRIIIIVAILTLLLTGVSAAVQLIG